jgi:hypothetical protein
MFVGRSLSWSLPLYVSSLLLFVVFSNAVMWVELNLLEFLWLVVRLVVCPTSSVSPLEDWMIFMNRMTVARLLCLVWISSAWISFVLSCLPGIRVCILCVDVFVSVLNLSSCYFTESPPPPVLYRYDFCCVGEASMCFLSGVFYVPMPVPAVF